MRTSLPWILPAFLAVLSACTKPVQAELDETHAKLKALQERVLSVNRDLNDLNAIVTELVRLNKTVPDSFRETEDGYEVTFQDGKTITIHPGKDGLDGRVFPIGVDKDEDGRYYWTIDYTPEDEEGPVWLTDAEGNRLLAGAADGKDGIAPVLKVEEDAWWISTDGGVAFEKLADCSYLDGVGVFSDVDASDPERIRLIQWNGTELDIPRYIPVKVSFAGQPRDTLLIAGGERLTIPFEVLLEGGDDTGTPVVTSGTDGTYFSEIEMDAQSGTGVVKVQAPAVFTEGYILLQAYCGGASALKVISFRERVVSPADPVIPVRMGSGAETADILYEANFEYVLTPAASWLAVQADPETRTVSFQAESNPEPAVRICEVAVSPKDNPDFVMTTFRVYQATETLTIDTPEIQAPAAGGDFDVWITWTPERMQNLTCSAGEEWITAEMAVESGFCHLKVHVTPHEGETFREGSVSLIFGSVVPVGSVRIIQEAAPAAPGE